MNTCDLASPAFSFRARGCVLMEDPGIAEEASRLKAEAEAEARKIATQKALAQKEIETARQQGTEAAEKRMQQQIEALRTTQKQLWAGLNTELAQTLSELEGDIRQQLIGMSIRIAEIILCRLLPDAAMVRQVLEEVLAPISDLQGVRVRVAPGTLDILTGGGDTPGLKPGLECVEDPELKPGDVFVESRNGIFDGRLRSRLDHLAEVLAQPPVDMNA